MVGPKGAAAELIGAGACDHRYLSRSSRRLRIDRSNNDLHFFNKVGTRVRDGPGPILITAVRNIDAIPGRIGKTETAAGHHADKTSRRLDACRGPHEGEDV